MGNDCHVMGNKGYAGFYYIETRVHELLNRQKA